MAKAKETTTDKETRASFVRDINSRVSKAIAKIESIGDLAKRKAHTEADLTAINNAIAKAVNTMNDKFAGKTKASFELK